MSSFESNIKINIHLFIRWIKDLLSLNIFILSKKTRNKDELSFLYSVELEQAIKTNSSTLPKLKNLQIAIKLIEEVIIYPNQIFSFWKIVGNPSLRNGFVYSRSLIRGELQSSVGGGLCQLSGLIYYLCLISGLSVIERYNHSVDIYTESTRFTPLGSDATVAYGYKDLRFKNNTNVPIKFSFVLTENILKISLKSTEKIKSHVVNFRSNQVDENKIEVTTFVDDIEFDKSLYMKLS